MLKFATLRPFFELFPHCIYPTTHPSIEVALYSWPDNLNWEATAPLHVSWSPLLLEIWSDYVG